MQYKCVLTQSAEALITLSALLQWGKTPPPMSTLDMIINHPMGTLRYVQ